MLHKPLVQKRSVTPLQNISIYNLRCKVQIDVIRMFLTQFLK